MSSVTSPVRGGGKAGARTAEQQIEEKLLSVNERIMRDVFDIYTVKRDGLCAISNRIGLVLDAPRKKINVLLMGNHSAGKSSFINWYIEEHIQKTGVAIETQGFSIITSGKKRETLSGNATLKMFPFLTCCAEAANVIDYLSTEISTSKQKHFSMVNFIDTPGMVDGGMTYPFKVTEAMKQLGDIADLIFVFFDPIGQALCRRTIDLVEHYGNTHYEKLRFYLSKADEAGSETDRQRVLMQIVQELCKRKGLNKTCFDMPTIYIPPPDGRPVRCVNQIDEVCTDIEKTINHSVQHALNKLEEDCVILRKRIVSILAEDDLTRARRFKVCQRRICLYALASLIPAILFFALSVTYLHAPPSHYLSSSLSTYAFQAEETMRSIVGALPSQYLTHLLAVFGFFALLCFLVARYSSKPAILKNGERRELEKYRESISQVVKRKEELYGGYLRQCLTFDEM